MNRTDPTCIGRAPSQLTWDTPLPAPRKLSLLGLGTVGLGVYRHLQAFPELFDVRHVVVRNQEAAAQAGVPLQALGLDPNEACDQEVDAIIDTLGKAELTQKPLQRAAERGVQIISADKALLAQTSANPGALTTATGSEPLHSACVGGGVPVLEHLVQENSPPISRVRGILNGTSNFVLDQCQTGLSLDQAIETAQALGFAEDDPTRDLTGVDAAQKLSIIAAHLGLPPVPWDQIPTEPIHGDSPIHNSNVCDPAAFGSMIQGTSRLFQVASLEAIEGDWQASVRLCHLPATDPLFHVRGENNAVVIESPSAPARIVQGKGAGRWPTAESVLGDLLQWVRREASLV